MLDPLSMFSAPPPRYLLESDSSDEEGQGQYPSGSRVRAPAVRHEPAVNVHWLGDDTAAVPVRTAVVGIGQAGNYLVRRAGARLAVLRVEVDGADAGMGFVLGDQADGLLLVLREGDEKGDGTSAVVEKLVALVKADKWTVFSSYAPALYTPDASEDVYISDPPVRYLSVGLDVAEPKLKHYDAPNYTTGLAAAFLSQATHPAFPLNAVSLFLLPLPLSRLAPAGLAAALATLPSPLDAAFARAVPWTEADDEPYAGLGMGAHRASKEVAPSAGNLSGMYM